MTKTCTSIAGDMWDGISYRVYGSEAYTDKLMKYNPQYRSIVIFPAGLTIKIPEVHEEASLQLPPWKRGIK